MALQNNPSAYFLPYQIAWLNDQSRFKIIEKSRRVGMTYVQSYEDVRDAARQDGMDVWFSSADESAAVEYILYCQKWAKLFDAAAEYLGEVVIDSEKDIKALSIKFSSGFRVNALSSNPKAFRSKGGKLVLDEFAFHKQPDEMWKAAVPIITWGYPVRVLSTYNGKGNRYYRMVQDAKKAESVSSAKDSRWSLHTTTIEDAVEQGLVSKILGKEANDADKAAFIADCKAAAGDDETYQQEYMCIPVDEASAWLTWDLITACEHEDAGKPELYQGGPCYVGMDIARRRDLFIIWVDEKVGDVFWCRQVIALKNASFAQQDDALESVMNYFDVKRLCGDQTGIGEKPIEDAKKKYGEYVVEGVLFTGSVKQHLATIIKQQYEDKKTRTPVDKTIRDSHHAVRKMQTVAGNPRFDADRTELGHADEFWGHALAIHAAEDLSQPAAGAQVASNHQQTFSPSKMIGRMRSKMFPRR